MNEYLKHRIRPYLFIKNIEMKFKRIVHPKIENSVINYLPSCHSKPVRPSFIFTTQKKLLMKSESFVTIHRQQRNCYAPER